MKKLLLILALTVVLPSMAYAKCDGGTEKSGQNGHVYCISDKQMNWWSAFAWCKANERPLATLAQACNNQNWSSGCTNWAYKGGIRVWTAIASGTETAYFIHFDAVGTVNSGTRTTNYYALCY